MWPLSTVTEPKRRNSARDLFAFARSPAPGLIDGPERHMGEDHHRLAGGAAGQIVLQPSELIIAQRAQAVGLEVHHIDQGDKMHALGIETVIAAIAWTACRSGRRIPCPARR